MSPPARSAAGPLLPPPASKGSVMTFCTVRDCVWTAATTRLLELVGDGGVEHGERRALRRVREERVARLVSSATMVSAMVSRATARLAIAREVRAARLRTLQIHVCCACNSLLVATQGCARRPHRLTLTP